VVRDSLPLRTKSSRYSETSVRNYHYTLSNNLEERVSYPITGGSLKSTVNVFTLLSEQPLLLITPLTNGVLNETRKYTILDSIR